MGSLFCIVVTALLVGWLAVCALARWPVSAVTSGSMAPTIRRGDVVAVRPPPGERLGPGAVIRFRTPHGYVVHRVVAPLPHGYRTRGDANAVADSSPVALDDVIGVGVLVVPLIGLPSVWLAEGNYLSVLAAAVTALAAIRFSRYAIDARYDPWPATEGTNADLGPWWRRAPLALGARLAETPETEQFLPARLTLMGASPHVLPAKSTGVA